MAHKPRKPKQDFTINYEKIVSNEDLKSSQKILLLNLLIYHKANCKNRYKHILNGELESLTKMRRPTLAKTRDSLEELKYFTVKIKLFNKSVEVAKDKRKNNGLCYHFDWSVLKKIGFINEQKNEFKERFVKKVNTSHKVNKKPQLPKNKALTIKEKDLIDDVAHYKVKVYNYVNGSRIGSGNTKTMIGKNLKIGLNINENHRKHGDADLTEYILI